MGEMVYFVIVQIITVSLLLTIMDYKGIIYLPRSTHEIAKKVKQIIETEIRLNGPIPRHIAFIMDGNRRFARSRLQSSEDGHSQGAVVLSKTLELCYSLGISTVTAFAFSTENFTRKPTELASVFSIMKDKARSLSLSETNLKRSGLRVRVIGNVSMFPEGLQEALNKVSTLTKDNRENTLNLCCAYTSREEIVSAVQSAASGIENNFLYSDDVNEKFINSLMQASRSWNIEAQDQQPEHSEDKKNPEDFKDTVRDVDMLIRTSGEYRVSDFLTWQISDKCLIQFFDRYWPEFGPFDLFVAVIDYQRYFYSSLKNNIPRELSNSSNNPHFWSLRHELGFDDLSNEKMQSAQLRINNFFGTLVGN